MLTGLLYAMPGEIKSLLPEGAEPERVEAGVPFTASGRTWWPAAAAWER